MPGTESNPAPDTWELTEKMIRQAYELGWVDGQADVGAMIPSKPPTLTIQHTPGKGIVFLYDGRPRP